MSDRFFYPFIVLLIGAIVFAALYAGGPMKTAALTPDEIAQQGYTVEGEDLRRFVSAPGTTVNFALDSTRKVSSAVLAAHISKASAPPSAGVFVTLGPSYESVFGGKSIDVTVRAKQGGDNPSDSFTMQYFTASVGDSRPERLALTRQYQDFTLTFTPNPPKGEPGADYVGIWPDLEGEKRTMDVESIRVQITQ